jgi:hypothetical protein
VGEDLSEGRKFDGDVRFLFCIATAAFYIQYLYSARTSISISQPQRRPKTL